MICCLNPHCSQENPPCPDGTKYCFSCGTELMLLSDRYRPVKRLGEGGFGITYLAEDNERFGKSCVIKQLTLHVPEARRLFEGEARRLEELANYPAIPRLLSYRSDTNYLYLVQEFVEGQDLGKELRQNGSFDESRVKDFLKAILPILEVIHNKGIIHRDIKLDNIMLGSDNKIVLIDFGIAKLIPANNTLQPGTRAGTDGYAAPEQMKEGRVSPASDLYSLGAACFHLLTSIDPGNMFMDYGYQWTTGWQRHLKTSISKELELIINNLLKTEYQDRYQSADKVLKAFDKVSSLPTKSIGASAQENPTQISYKPTPLSQKVSPIKSIPNNRILKYWSSLDSYLQVLMIGAGFVLFLSIAVSLFQPVSSDNNPSTAKDNDAEKSTEAMKLNPNSPESYNDRGVDKYNSGDHKGAIEDYTKAIKNNPNFSEAFTNRGISKRELSDHKGAIEDYNKAIKIKSNYPEAYFERGFSKESLNDQKGAIEDYTKAIQFKPNYPEAYRNRSLSKEILGDHTGAVNDCTQSITLKPDYPEAFINRGYFKYNLGDKKGAIEDYTKSINLNSDFPEAFYNRGISKYDLGDKKGAIEDYGQASKLYQKQGKEQDYQDTMRVLKEIDQ
jgi:serine/threonine protein kinase